MNKVSSEYAAIKKLPKVELHAHLFGSIRRESLLNIKAKKSQNQHTNNTTPKNDTKLTLGGGGGDSPVTEALSLDSAFEYFKLVYEVVDNCSVIWEVMKEVIADFHSDNVVYLELRSTLKEIPHSDVTFENYAMMLVNLVTWAADTYDMTVRLLLSINREKVVDAASAKYELDNVLRIALMHPKYIVGIDIAGNPKKGDLTFLLPLLKSNVLNCNDVVCNKLKLTIHTAEITAEEETEEILKILPHRLGHACFLTPTQMSFVRRNQIPIEICPTSNAATMPLNSMADHHFSDYYFNHNYKQLCICTDDIGYFSTSLTDELHHLSAAFSLNISDIEALQLQSLEAAFCDEDVKSSILSKYFTAIQNK